MESNRLQENGFQSRGLDTGVRVHFLINRIHPDKVGVRGSLPMVASRMIGWDQEVNRANRSKE